MHRAVLTLGIEGRMSLTEWRLESVHMEINVSAVTGVPACKEERVLEGSHL